MTHRLTPITRGALALLLAVLTLVLSTLPATAASDGAPTARVVVTFAADATAASRAAAFGSDTAGEEL